MARLTLQEASNKMGGRILTGTPSSVCEGYGIDTRQIQRGQLFFSVIAERDGHNYIVQAAEKGALGAVISKKTQAPNKDFALIEVNDTLKALQDLSKNVRADSGAEVIGITGSIGKTTVKSFAAHLLSHRYSILESRGNFNNHLGLPLTLLRLEPEHEVAILEMAMNSPGEIGLLTRISNPNVAVITNVNPVHLEFFQNIDGIALAKKEILDNMDPSRTAVLNGDDPHVRKIASDWKGDKIWFGLSEKCDIRAGSIRKESEDGITCHLKYGKTEGDVHLPFLYHSYLYNFLAASAIAHTQGIPVEDIIKRSGDLVPLPDRGRLYTLKNGIRLIDDSYNSNPAALESALDSLSEIRAERRVAVLGDMLELGQKEQEFHREAGRQAHITGWDLLITVGPMGEDIKEGAMEAGMDRSQIYSFQTSEEAARLTPTILQSGDLVLVKGSRGVHTEKIVASIKERGN
ncbi:UDP-N-acetylmuramoyl-tripeptide--D-alanyl-D-alanine ligase [Acidobacteriota bacterium]